MSIRLAASRKSWIASCFGYGPTTSQIYGHAVDCCGRSSPAALYVSRACARKPSSSDSCALGIDSTLVLVFCIAPGGNYVLLAHCHTCQYTGRFGSTQAILCIEPHIPFGQGLSCGCLAVSTIAFVLHLFLVVTALHLGERGQACMRLYLGRNPNPSKMMAHGC